MKGGKRDRRVVTSDPSVPSPVESKATDAAVRRLELCSSTRITQAGFAPFFLAFDLSFSMPDAGTLPANGEAWPIGRG
jgi:hypothetical protein